ncbi:MAG: cysteine desulfurase, partial [Myxococcota bacterium]
MRRTYLDHNASAPLSEAASNAMRGWLDVGHVGNPSSIYAEGRRARRAVEDAREHVAQAIGARPKDIVFTSGATEANVTVLRAASGPIVCSAIEHPSVLETAELLGARVVGVDSGGRVDPSALEGLLEPGALCSIVWANNEIGTIQDVTDIAGVCRKVGALLHLDGAQALGKIPVDVTSIDCDFLTLSSHKIGGPIGAGALWIRPGLAVDPLMTGGHQERGRRAGTEPVLSLIGFGAAATEVDARLEAAGHVTGLRDRLADRLVAAGGRINGCMATALPNTLNIRFDDVAGDALLMALDMAGVAASSGSACTAGSLEPSHVLLALGLTHDEASQALRFSLGP